ncbi:MAG: hypothetical protein HQM07_00375 [Zetaproteobacteria bacterium]|nr:hypothetical protein [Zetaproteobacteria bacterium]
MGNLQGRLEDYCTDYQLNELAAMITEQTGVVCLPHQWPLLKKVLIDRTQALNIDSIRGYLSALEFGEPQELTLIANHLTAKHGTFFADSTVVHTFQNDALPDLRTRRASIKKINIWCISNDQGQDAYSLAALCQQYLTENWQVSILMTSLNQSSLDHATAGIYAAKDIEAISIDQRNLMFQYGTGQHEGKVRIKPSLRQRLHTRPFNLMWDWPMEAHFDAIFCADILSHYDKKVQSAVLLQIEKCVLKSGYLFLGEKELFSLNPLRFQRIRQENIYQLTVIPF